MIRFSDVLVLATVEHRRQSLWKMVFTCFFEHKGPHELLLQIGYRNGTIVSLNATLSNGTIEQKTNGKVVHTEKVCKSWLVGSPCTWADRRTAQRGIFPRAWLLGWREYGTRVYREMFVILASDNLPAIEVRRNPASTGLKGIHDAEETHIRVVNRLCYFDDCAEKFRNWLDFYHYTDIRISRVDVCMDFVRFDFGDEPFRFVKRYVSHKYAKYAGVTFHYMGKTVGRV